MKKKWERREGRLSVLFPRSVCLLFLLLLQLLVVFVFPLGVICSLVRKWAVKKGNQRRTSKVPRTAMRAPLGISVFFFVLT